MAESESIKDIVNQVAAQATLVVMMALRDAEARPWPTTAVSHRGLQKLRKSGSILIKPLFNWGLQDRYVGLLNFEMEVLKILDNKLYEFSEKESQR